MQKYCAQIQDIQEVMNLDLGNSNAKPLIDYYPRLDQNPNNQASFSFFLTIYLLVKSGSIPH